MMSTPNSNPRKRSMRDNTTSDSRAKRAFNREDMRDRAEIISQYKLLIKGLRDVNVLLQDTDAMKDQLIGKLQADNAVKDDELSRWRKNVGVPKTQVTPMYVGGCFY